MKLIADRVELRMCSSCGSEHIGVVPCGMTAKERFGSVKLASDWMPAKREARRSGETEYYDDESLSAIFQDGLTGDERKEQLMDETQGVGYATAEEIAKYPELAVAHYLDGGRDEDDG